MESNNKSHQQQQHEYFAYGQQTKVMHATPVSAEFPQGQPMNVGTPAYHPDGARYMQHYNMTQASVGGYGGSAHHMNGPPPHQYYKGSGSFNNPKKSKFDFYAETFGIKSAPQKHLQNLSTRSPYLQQRISHDYSSIGSHLDRFKSMYQAPGVPCAIQGQPESGPSGQDSHNQQPQTGINKANTENGQQDTTKFRASTDHKISHQLSTQKKEKKKKTSCNKKKSEQNADAAATEQVEQTVNDKGEQKETNQKQQKKKASKSKKKKKKSVDQCGQSKQDQNQEAKVDGVKQREDKQTSLKSVFENMPQTTSNMPVIKQSIKLFQQTTDQSSKQKKGKKRDQKDIENPETAQQNSPPPRENQPQIEQQTGIKNQQNQVAIEKKRDLKFVQKETVRLKNGKYVQATKKSTGSLFIQIVSQDLAAISFHKFYDESIKRVLIAMNGFMYNTYESNTSTQIIGQDNNPRMSNDHQSVTSKQMMQKGVFHIQFDPDRNLFLFPINCINIIFEKLEPHCRKKRFNLIGVPEFVHKFLQKPVFMPKKRENEMKMKRQMQARLEKLRAIGRTVSMSDELPEEPVNDCFENQKNIDDLPEELVEKLFEFQREGVKFGIKKSGRILIGDEMGVGKTIQALAIAYVYRKEWPLLVICPASLKYIWKDEILKWIPTVNQSDIQIIEQGKEQFVETCCVFIMSYELAAKRSQDLEDYNFQCCIADEAHYLKSRDTKRTKKLLPLLTKSARVQLLTGTPILSHPVELYNLLKIVRPDVMTSFTQYTQRYCDPVANHFGVDYTGATCIDELNYLLNYTLMIRRLKKDVLQQLPSKTRQKVPIKLDPVLLKKIKKKLDTTFKKQTDMRKFVEKKLKDMPMDDDLEEYDPEDYDTKHLKYKKKLHGNDECGENAEQVKEKMKQTEEEYMSFMEAYKLTGLAKIEGVCDFIDTLLENNVKFLLFAHHKATLDQYENYCEKKCLRFIRIDGSTPLQTRHDLVTRFQSDESIRCALLSITACAMGLTLTCASSVLFAESTWTPAMMIQAEDRAHRIGQKQNVSIYYMHGTDTVDDVLFQLLEDKQTVITTALDGKTASFQIKDSVEGEQVQIERTVKSINDHSHQKNAPQSKKNAKKTIFDFEDVDYDMTKIKQKKKRKIKAFDQCQPNAMRENKTLRSLRRHLNKDTDQESEGEAKLTPKPNQTNQISNFKTKNHSDQSTMQATANASVTATASSDDYQPSDNGQGVFSRTLTTATSDVNMSNSATSQTHISEEQNSSDEQSASSSENETAESDTGMSVDENDRFDCSQQNDSDASITSNVDCSDAKSDIVQSYSNSDSDQEDMTQKCKQLKTNQNNNSKGNNPALLQSTTTEEEYMKDIGSGLNGKRKQKLDIPDGVQTDTVTVCQTDAMTSDCAISIHKQTNSQQIQSQIIGQKMTDQIATAQEKKTLAESNYQHYLTETKSANDTDEPMAISDHPSKQLLDQNNKQQLEQNNKQKLEQNNKQQQEQNNKQQLEQNENQQSKPQQINKILDQQNQNLPQKIQTKIIHHNIKKASIQQKDKCKITTKPKKQIKGREWVIAPWVNSQKQSSPVRGSSAVSLDEKDLQGILEDVADDCQDQHSSVSMDKTLKNAQNKDDQKQLCVEYERQNEQSFQKEKSLQQNEQVNRQQSLCHDVKRNSFTNNVEMSNNNNQATPIPSTNLLPNHHPHRVIKRMRTFQEGDENDDDNDETAATPDNDETMTGVAPEDDSLFNNQYMNEFVVDERGQMVKVQIGNQKQSSQLGNYQKMIPEQQMNEQQDEIPEDHPLLQEFPHLPKNLARHLINQKQPLPHQPSEPAQSIVSNIKRCQEKMASRRTCVIPGTTAQTHHMQPMRRSFHDPSPCYLPPLPQQQVTPPQTSVTVNMAQHFQPSLAARMTANLNMNPPSLNCPPHSGQILSGSINNGASIPTPTNHGLNEIMEQAAQAARAQVEAQLRQQAMKALPSVESLQEMMVSVMMQQANEHLKQIPKQNDHKMQNDQQVHQKQNDVNSLSKLKKKLRVSHTQNRISPRITG